jgi:excisionase family DNA binding protein
MFMETDENELLTVEQLCERLFISPTTAYKLLQSGEIRAFKIGTWKIPVQSVYEYIRKRCRESMEGTADK